LEGGGEYFAAGVRGPITGRRADLIIIDDPVKSWAEAESQTFRDALYDWYRAELSARLKPGGPVVLMMTRWHEDDLAGRLLAESTWSCLRLPAIFRQFPGRHSWNTAVLSLQQAKAGSQHLRGTPRLPCSHETGDVGGPVRESVTHSRRLLGAFLTLSPIRGRQSLWLFSRHVRQHDCHRGGKEPPTWAARTCGAFPPASRPRCRRRLMQGPISVT
jgi:hypothetical protein